MIIDALLAACDDEKLRLKNTVEIVSRFRFRLYSTQGFESYSQSVRDQVRRMINSTLTPWISQPS